MNNVVRPTPIPSLSPRARTLVLLGVLFLLLLLYGWFALDFRRQRQAQRLLQGELHRYQAFVATVAPTVADIDRLEAQLEAARARLATAQAGMPGGEGLSVLDTLVQVGRRSGVTVEQVEVLSAQAVGDGIERQRYAVQATGPLDGLTAFVNNVEQDALPTARFQDVNIARDEEDGTYRLEGTLVVLSAAAQVAAAGDTSPTPTDAQRAEELRARYEEALARGDYELALSALIRLSLLEPAGVDDLLYDTYVAYGNALLAQGFLEAAEAQFREALNIRPEGEEAVLGLLQVSEARTATPQPTRDDSVAVGRTATPTLSPTPQGPSPTATRPPTQQPPPTNTPRPTRTRTPHPTRTPGPSPTSSVTPTATRAAGPTDTPAPAGPPSPYQFGPTTPFYLPNCGLTQIKGTIKTESGQPLNGVTVRVWWDGAPADQVYSLPSGTDPRQPAGYWDVVLAPYPKEGKWYVAVVDRETGAYLSEIVTVFTDLGDCRPGGTGRQVVIVDFIRFAGQYGTPAPTSTPTKTPRPQPSPTSTPTATSTPTVTPTPSPTPTPTPSPLRYQMSGDPLPIPEDINNPLVASFTVSEDVAIREVQVFVYIEHDDTYDLRIELLTPYGDVITLQEEERIDEDGPTRISRWYNVDGSDLDRIVGKSSAGTWSLRVTDTKPAGTTGTLNNWILEIYP